MPPSSNQDVQAMVEALSSPIRREILWMTWNEERAAGEIAAAFDVAAPTISGHLAALRHAGLVTMRTDGNFRRYRTDHAAVRVLIPLLRTDDARWARIRELDEQRHADARIEQLVRVSVDLDVDQATAFHAFTDPSVFSRWLGVPVRLDGNRFACTLEWGTRVRGHYVIVVPPGLIALRWDFDDDTVPLPGRELVAYLRFEPRRRGSLVEVHQHATDETQAEFLVAAWSMVLGRLKLHDS